MIDPNNLVVLRTSIGWFLIARLVLNWYFSLKLKIRFFKLSNVYLQGLFPIRILIILQIILSIGIGYINLGNWGKHYLVRANKIVLLWYFYGSCCLSICQSVGNRIHIWYLPHMCHVWVFFLWKLLLLVTVELIKLSTPLISPPLGTGLWYCEAHSIVNTVNAVL